MSIQEGSPPSSSRPRERMIQAMLIAVARRGFRATTVEEILRQARVTRRSFEATFPEGRRECLLAAYEQAVDQAFETVETACERAGGVGIRAVEAGLRALLHSMVECPIEARVCVVEIASLGATGREARNRTIERFATLLSGVIGGPALSRTQAEATVAGWYYVLHATVLEGRTGELGQILPDMVYMVTTRRRELADSAGASD
jgi:AcrR family transcriptional regulator